MDLVRGQKLKISDIASATQVEVALTLGLAANQTIDVSCFGLDGFGKLSDDRYFIFYNQKSSPCGSLAAIGPSSSGQEVFRIDLERLPPTIQRLVFTATLDQAGTMAGLGSSRMELRAGGRVCATYTFSGADFGGEKAIMIAEIYKKGVWRLAANGQGFNGGLSALLAHFGGTEAEPQPAAGQQVAAAPASPLAPPPAPAPKVNLGKVSLEKRGASHRVDLRKGGGTQPIQVNLNWDQPQASRGFLGSLMRPGKVDLDLGCMYRLTTGEAGVIQPLGRSFGSRTSPPYIFLDQDDRTGSSASGENLCIFRPDLIDLVVVFALIYEGTANFSTVNGRLTLRDEAGSEVFVPLNTPDPTKPFCAVASVRRDGSTVRITKDERYFPGHRECDEAYGFGFRWTEGQK